MTKKIKVIELLNEIANGEEVPKRIKWRDKIWDYIEKEQDYINHNIYFFEGFTQIRTKDFVTDTVEIIEDKEIGQENNRESKVKQTSDEFTEETRYYTPEGEIYETTIKTYKFPKNYISKDKIREKIKELEEKIHVVTPDTHIIDKITEFKNEGALNILQELLEEE